jgi:hypothetical protein
MPTLAPTDRLNARQARRRIVLTTFGSLGDLHPYIAVALGLKEHGHEAVIATYGSYRQKIEALSIGFPAVRPDVPDREADLELRFLGPAFHRLLFRCGKCSKGRL